MFVDQAVHVLDGLRETRLLRSGLGCSRSIGTIFGDSRQFGGAE